MHVMVPPWLWRSASEVARQKVVFPLVLRDRMIPYVFSVSLESAPVVPLLSPCCDAWRLRLGWNDSLVWLGGCWCVVGPWDP